MLAVGGGARPLAGRAAPVPARVGVAVYPAQPVRGRLPEPPPRRLPDAAADPAAAVPGDLRRGRHQRLDRPAQARHDAAAGPVHAERRVRPRAGRTPRRSPGGRGGRARPPGSRGPSSWPSAARRPRRRCARGSTTSTDRRRPSGPPGSPTRAGPGPPGRAICASCWAATSSCSSTEVARRERSPDAYSPSIPILPPPVHRLADGRLAAAARGSSPSCWRDGAARSRDADPLAPRAPHFPGKAKRVIFLFMTGGVSHLESFDPKPRLAADARQAAQGPDPAAAAVQVRPGRPVRDAGQRAVPARRHVRRRPLRDPLADRQPLRALPGDARRAHRVADRQAAEPRLVGQLRPGDREPQPAVVRRARAAPALRRHAGLVERLPAGLPPGDAHPARRRADPRPAPPLAERRRPGDGAGPARRASTAGTSRTGRADPLLAGRIQLVRDGLRHAARDARRARPVEGDRRHAATSTAWSAAAPTASPGSAWSPGGWPSAACGSSS